MTRNRRELRASGGASAPRGAAERAVHAAEKIVRSAWVIELARRRDGRAVGLRIERRACDAALALLAAAQRDGDPRQISAARTAVLQALADVCTAVAARDEARRTLLDELNVLTRKPEGLSAQRRPRTLRHLIRRSAPGLEQP